MRLAAALTVAVASLSLVVHAQYDEWELLWSDEFDSATTTVTAPNNDNWNIREGFLGLNSEFQTYTSSPDNVNVQDGKLHLTAIRDSNAQVGYTSGRVNTKDKMLIKYATVEASIKIPAMKLGLWPAFWTLGQDYDEVGWPAAGELDIMEIGQKQGFAEGKLERRVLSAIHWQTFDHYTEEAGYLDMNTNLSHDFHTYKMEWQPEYIATYIDDFLIKRFRIADCFTLWDCPELHQPHFLVMNLAVAGAFTCCEYGFEPNDYPNGTAWTMEVDYVRVYGNEHTEIILSSDVAKAEEADATSIPGTTSEPSVVAESTTVPTQRPTGPSSILPTSAPASIAVGTVSPTESQSTVEPKTEEPSTFFADQTTTGPTPTPQTQTFIPTTVPDTFATETPTEQSFKLADGLPDTVDSGGDRIATGMPIVDNNTNNKDTSSPTVIEVTIPPTFTPSSSAPNLRTGSPTKADVSTATWNPSANIESTLPEEATSIPTPRIEDIETETDSTIAPSQYESSQYETDLNTSAPLLTEATTQSPLALSTVEAVNETEQLIEAVDDSNEAGDISSAQVESSSKRSVIGVASIAVSMCTFIAWL